MDGLYGYIVGTYVYLYEINRHKYNLPILCKYNCCIQ